MEILTLLRANIRRKKGSFVSVVLLTLIIAMSITVVLSTRDSALKGIDYAHEIRETPDLSVYYMSFKLTDDMIESVKEDSRVESVNVLDSILFNKTIMGGNEYRNTSMLYKDDENVKILKGDLSGIENNSPQLQKGEIYVSQGILTNLKGKVGEKITLETIAGDFEFTVKGVLLEPLNGSAMIGWKSYRICEEDYREIYERIVPAETEDKHALGKTLEINKSDECELSNAQFRRQLNIDTGVTDMAYGSITRDMSVHYTSLFVTIGSAALTVFAITLLVIVVIVTVHSISVEIETEYVTFGVLKAQGFDTGKIRLLFLGQYLLAEIIGAVLGVILSIPLVGVSSNIFVYNTAVPSVLSIPFWKIGAIIGALFLLSAVSVFFITKKVGKISPVRAISGAKREIYFDSRINAPISKGILSPSLAFRQFTSAKRRYAGTLAIAAVLMFFMVTVTLLADSLSSKRALEAMGAMVTQITVSPKGEISEDKYKEIEREIERFAPIEKAYYSNNTYFSLEGEEMMGCVYEDPSLLPVINGRSPIYDNEIAASPIVLEEFNLKIGDEVKIGLRDKRDKFLIVGTVQLTNDTGRCFLMPYNAALKIGYDYPMWGSYSLENWEIGDNEEFLKEIANSLNEKYGDILEVTENSFLDGSIDLAIEAIRIIIYVFSVLFALIVIHMVCSKAFVQERTDIGIYKAIGFNSANLRLQFAFRFLIVSVIGAALGAVFSFFLSGKMLELLLKSIGLTNFDTSGIFSSFTVPVIIICGSFMVFSYFASGKIRRVRIRELVME